MRLKVDSLIIIVFFLVFSCKNEKEANISNTTVKEYQYTNALIDETSPYLLKHAHNPVNWVPWSKSALELAKKQRKLLVLSIGYSSCHWCSVMEKESFEDEDVAQLMNEFYVNIKVDRDERPDIDLIYQTALQMVNDFGGWPLNAIILPNGKPIYLGTYHEKERWIAVLSNFSEEYKKNPDKIMEYADLLAEGIQENYQLKDTQGNTDIPIDLISESMHQWFQKWDLKSGGDTSEQKFVIPSKMELLLDYGLLKENQDAKSHFKNSIDLIAQSGLYDHLGGGFFRYTTDAEWKFPHFEKMLYDNAQLLSLYSKAYRVFKDQNYKRLVEETFEFLEREMKSPQGGYYSSLDASSNGIEGGFYTWNKAELKSILSEEYKLLDNYFGKTVLKDTVGGRYLLYPYSPESAYNSEEILSKEEWNVELDKLRKSLFRARQQREAPKKDDKIITSWNALLVNGFIEAYMAFGDSKYLKEAEEIFRALKKHNIKNGRPVHSYKVNSKQNTVFLEDYAQLIACSWNLYKASLNTEYLEDARSLMDMSINEFGNSSTLFSYSNSENLIANVVDKVDGVMPSSNATMAKNLFELGMFDFNKSYIELSKNMAGSLRSDFLGSPESYGQWGKLFLNSSLPFYEIVVIGPKANVFLQRLNEHYLPNTLIVGSIHKSESFLFKGRYIDGQTLFYVCMDNTCKLPVNSIEDAFDQLKGLGYNYQVKQVVPYFKTVLPDFKQSGS